MTTPMTEKQAAYRQSLIDQNIANEAVNYRQNRPQALINVALLASLPLPSDKADASAQIDALKAYNIQRYGAQHKDWANGIIGTLIGVWGADGAQWPVVKDQYDGLATGADLVTAVKRVIN
jgi:hypothetical protein